MESGTVVKVACCLQFMSVALLKGLWSGAIPTSVWKEDSGDLSLFMLALSVV